METKANGPRERYDRLVHAAQQLPPVTTAVAHPCDRISIEGVVEAAQLGLIAPILVGPPARIHEAAEQAEADISSFPLEQSAHSHDSAAKAVELVRQGKAEALMKGSLHTDELMGAVVARETGIRTARRISHCFVMDVPGHKDPLIITDAAVNIAPSLADKVDIVQNAIDLGHALGFQEVRVAVMSAMETVNPAVPSTIEAAALCKMAERGQITGSSTARWRSTMQSTRTQRRSSTSSPRWRDAPTCWRCRTSNPATCWPRASRSLPARLPQASFSVPVCRSS
jgi:phosphate acetyltransferase